MREHECLYFVSELTAWMKREPTREEVIVNYFDNHERFVGVGSSMRTVMRRLRLKNAITERRCSPSCHARHVHITAHGRALLDLWNEKGCEAERRTQEVCVADNFTFKEQEIA